MAGPNNGIPVQPSLVTQNLLAYNGARQSSGSVLDTMFHMIYENIILIIYIECVSSDPMISLRRPTTSPYLVAHGELKPCAKQTTWLTSIDSLAPGRFVNGWGIYCEVALRWISDEPHWRSVNIGSGNGLAPSSNKPLPEPMSTQIPVHIWRH